eukprot:CAMPEP_0198291760 /NCGR_PEP_ID=MMETSP1449-20131203/9179_1 /TAXON_ID=420275 /ORGANISM="Attheya septentrionalis, Strain CCMP2084" /LENGTH=289 /DNA_ID=CAMNT_0043990441 /DNA_START=53 /DNA_END=922 /DNA_ORIENTATION=-
MSSMDPSTTEKPASCHEPSNPKKRSAEIPAEVSTDKKQNSETSTSSTSASSSTIPTSTSSAAVAESVSDVCETVELKPGDRVQVMWEVHMDNIDESSSHKHWWTGTLLSKDGRTHELVADDDDVDDKPVVVPIRTLDYDPYPQGGFPERSLEDVCFLSEHSILNVSSGSNAYYRKEGDNWEPTDDYEDRIMEAVEADTAEAESQLMSGNGATKEESMRFILDTVLQASLASTGGHTKMQHMNPAQRLAVAEKIATAKERLLERIMQHDGGGEITAETVRTFMAEAWSNP